jgi:hypothetical protein
MAYLGWSSQSLSIKHEQFLTEGRALTLGLSRDAAETLLVALAAIEQGTEKELRVDLPQGWTLFWKRREDDSRLLVAHPTDQTWVGTLALSPAHFEALRHAVSSGGRFSVFEGHSGVGDVSNFDLVLEPQLEPLSELK